MDGRPSVLRRGEGVNPFRYRTQHGRMLMAGRRRLVFLTTCSDDNKLYMILVALIKGFQNHIGFAIIRASGEEWQPLTSDLTSSKSAPFLDVTCMGLLIDWSLRMLVAGAGNLITL